MCGIAGLASVHGTPADPAVLRAMTDILAHRGPDGEGFVCRGPVGLGHRRLAIIDLTTGAQPIASDDGSAWIVFVGEIYNYRELRQELEAAGVRFRTASDTEVILRAWEAHGPACVPRLRGMFAFAILDERRRQLFLARDRAGIKPLVYAWDGERLLFASELKALLRAPGLPRDVDEHALAEYLTYHYVPAPRTIFRAARKLPPASTLTLSLDGGAPVVTRYWQLELRPDPRPSEAEWVERLRAELADAVESHMIADVPIGAFLSGGVDSSTVVALMARASGRPIRTFSIGFDEADFDELAFARQVARRYGTDHYELVVKPSALDVLPRLAWQLDEPFADASAVPTYYVSKITREHVTVALSGDGGDEGFSGYRRYAETAALHARMDRGPRALARAPLAAASRLLPPGAFGQARAGLLGADPIARYFRMVTAQRRETLARLLPPERAALAAAATDPAPFRELAQRSGTADYVAQLSWIDIHTYLPGDILAKVDWTSMLVSLETRVPLLDHKLLELVATIPPDLKFRDGRGKWILKRAMADLLPPEILGRGKMGFGVPLAAWLRHELRDMAHDVLLSPRAAQRGLVRRDAVAGLLAEHAAGRRDHSARIWALLCLELWARTWLDGGAPSIAGGGAC